MIRISFRQGLLLGFTVMVLLLGGAVVRSWLVVERLLEESRRASAQAVELTAAVEELSDRSIDIERSARQYLILDDPLLHQRFAAHLAQSAAVVDRLEQQAAEPLAPLLAGWRSVAEALRESLERKTGEDDLAPLLRRLSELNGSLNQARQRWIDAQSQAMLADLEQSRLRLGWQVAIALGTLPVVVLAMVWWLLRPIRQLESAIGRLGANRFDEEIRVGGPADLRQLGHRLDWLRLRLAELEADRERALRHVSHELKTPLTSLKEGVALLQDEVLGDLGENQREVVEILQHNVANLQQQIESLLSLNAAVFEARLLQPVRVDLASLIQRIVQRRELHAQSRQVSITVELGDLAIAVLDEEKLSVVLDNLLSNAIDFSPQGGVVRLLVRRGQAGLRFECIDQGPGIAPEDRQRIFDPFVQGRQAAPAPRQGSGVGLSIVRELVRRMGGQSGLESAERGAHFFVELPDEI
ncbi:MAG TPA: ATP-binding protein [Rhodocyclaceae bacterium]|nr:ATP-binding protein [Rhodocyclaceae bacterium]